MGSAPYLLFGEEDWGCLTRRTGQESSPSLSVLCVKFSEREASSSSSFSSSSFLFSHRRLINVHKQGEMRSLMSKFFHQKKTRTFSISPSFSLTPSPASRSLGS